MFRILDPKATTHKSEGLNFSVKNINSSSNIKNAKPSVGSSITAFYKPHRQKQGRKKRLQKRQANPSCNLPSRATNIGAI